MSGGIGTSSPALKTRKNNKNTTITKKNRTEQRNCGKLHPLIVMTMELTVNRHAGTAYHLHRLSRTFSVGHESRLWNLIRLQMRGAYSRW